MPVGGERGHFCVGMVQRMQGPEPREAVLGIVEQPFGQVTRDENQREGQPIGYCGGIEQRSANPLRPVDVDEIGDAEIEDLGLQVADPVARPRVAEAFEPGDPCHDGKAGEHNQHR